MEAAEREKEEAEDRKRREAEGILDDEVEAVGDVVGEESIQEQPRIDRIERPQMR